MADAFKITTDWGQLPSGQSPKAAKQEDPEWNAAFLGEAGNCNTGNRASARNNPNLPRALSNSQQLLLLLKA